MRLVFFHIFTSKRKRKINMNNENQGLIINVLLFTGVFLVTYILLPRIRRITLKFDLYDTPDERSSHKSIVPTFGGVSFYIAIILSLFAIQYTDKDGVIISLLVSLSIIFFTGLKDDFQDISPRMKSLGQLLAVGLIIIHPEFRITSLHGFLGLDILHPIFSYLFSGFLFIGLINAYNLIDGIDGMASLVGIVIASSFGILFYQLELTFYLSICITLVAALFSFLRYNFSSEKKIFMGDTGSLLIGLILGVLTMRLLSLGFEPVSKLAITRAEIPLLLLCILIIPAFDISRVIFIRLSRNLPIFSPDRNHIHHVLIDAGYTHKKASITVSFINASIIACLYFSLRYLGVFPAFMVLVFLIILLVYFFFVIDKKYQTKKVKVKMRQFLYRFVTKLSFKRKKANTNRVLFNKKLKSIGILFL